MINALGQFIKTHGKSLTSEYNIWGNMLYRCNTESSALYNAYGGRGIRVSESWHTFEGFISDMGEKPSPEYSIDRVDVNGDYCKENCRWATKKQQSRNRTNSQYIYIEGEKMQVNDYCEMYNVSVQATKSRIRRKWSNERIISTPTRGYNLANN